MGNMLTIWDAVQDFLQFEIFRFSSDDKPIVITVGLLLLFVATFIAAHYLLRTIRHLIAKRLSEEEQLKFSTVFNFVKYFIYILIFIGLLSSAGIDITILLVSSTVLFVALGFALKEPMQDFLAGINIILDKSVLAGDIIEVRGTVSKVIDIKLRATKALTRDNKVIIIPNHLFLTETVFNYTQNNKIVRESIFIKAEYGADVEKITDALVRCASAHKKVLKSPEPHVILEDFAEYAMLFELRFFLTEVFRAQKVRSDIRFSIEREFRKEGITIPIPRQDLRIQSKESEMLRLGSQEIKELKR